MLRLTVTFLLINSWVFQTVQAKDRFELVLIHTNDLHSQFEETTNSKDGRKVGGCARVAHVVKEARKASDAGKGPPVLYFDAGDMFTGTIWFSLFKEEMSAEIMNVLNPDAACLGVHELDYNVPGLEKYLRATKFPVVISNLEFNNETGLASLIKKSLVLDVRGRKVGIVGFLAPDAAVTVEMGGLKILDEVTALKEESAKLIDSGVNIIIAVGHSGYFMNRFIAREVQLIDVIIGGGGSTFMWNGPQPDLEAPVESYPGTVVHSNGKYGLIAHAYCVSKYVGKLTLTFDSLGWLEGFYGQPIFLDETVPQDQEVLDIVESRRGRVNEVKATPICQSRVFLDGTDCCRKECNYGNLIVDSFIKYYARRYEGPPWTDAAVAIINAGFISESIDAPSKNNVVYMGDLLSSVPDDDDLYTTDIKGKYLKEALEIGTERNARNSGGAFLIASGLKVVYNFNDRYGQRVKSVKVRCAQCEVPEYFPLEPETVYKIITIRFLLRGGGVFRILMDSSTNTKPLGCKGNEALIKELQSKKFILPETGGRIMLETAVSDTKRHAMSKDLVLLPIILALLL